jgi:hypothetical protein
LDVKEIGNLEEKVYLYRLAVIDCYKQIGKERYTVNYYKMMINKYKADEKNFKKKIILEN